MNQSFRVGQEVSVTRVFTQADFDRFARLSGDDNPIHTDAEFSKRAKFGRTVAHGMLLYSIICSVLSRHLPGPETVQIEQELMFPSPTYTGEVLSIHLQVTSLDAEEYTANISTAILRPSGEVSCQGQTLVRVPGAPPTSYYLSVSTPMGEMKAPGNTTAYKGLREGLSASIKRTFTEGDIREYIDLTGDTNPIYTDERTIQRMGLEQTIIPGGLLGGLFSNLLGTKLPGRGTNWLKQRMYFPNPAYLSDEVTAIVEIVRLRPEKDLVNLRTVCKNPAGMVVCDGEALVLVKDLERSF